MVTFTSFLRRYHEPGHKKGRQEILTKEDEQLQLYLLFCSKWTMQGIINSVLVDQKKFLGFPCL
jgi:hypothetical protein